MTHYREPGTVEDVLAAVLRALSADEILTATGKKLALFRALSNPENPCSLDLDDAAALDAALVAKGLPARFRPLFDALHTAAVAKLGGAKPATLDLNTELRRLSIEVGTLYKAADDGMADGRLETHERRRIAHDAQDVSDRAIAIRDLVEPPPASVTPIHIRQGAR